MWHHNRSVAVYDAGFVLGLSNKKMVPTLPAHGSFYIIARHKRLGSGIGCILPHTARVGRTF